MKPVSDSGRSFLFISQVYPPDPAAVGQYLADTARELVARGHHVKVITADRGYDDPRVSYRRFETRDGVEIRRVPFSSFGKGSLAARLFGGVGFVVQAMLRGVFQRRVDTVVVSTSPPLALVAGMVVSVLRKSRLRFWVMDINPDQAVILGRIPKGSWMVRFLDRVYRHVMRRSGAVATLDSFMAERLKAKLPEPIPFVVVPPWPQESELEPVPHDRNPLRSEWDLQDRFVIGYSGNHGPSVPLDTVLSAAERLRDVPEVRFLFVGGGVEKWKVEAGQNPIVHSLPYQPLERIRYSLSAFDVHVVSIGDEMVGVVHPSKVYAAMAVGRPIIFIGPERSHVGKILSIADVGWRLDHGDVDVLEKIVRRCLSDTGQVREKGARARRLVDEIFRKDTLCGAMCDFLEGADYEVNLTPGQRALSAVGSSARDGDR